tara:strand:- start:843 stop:1205 length:363 start_codon:yes stop_codon:yes gene_type:complete
MKTFIAIVFVLFSSTVIAAEGDVYFCVEEFSIEYNPQESNEIITYKPQQYKFKRTSESLLFGAGNNFFDEYTMQLTYSVGEMFSATNGTMDRFKYENGKYYYSMVMYDSIISMSGTCSIF